MIPRITFVSDTNLGHCEQRGKNKVVAPKKYHKVGELEERGHYKSKLCF